MSRRDRGDRDRWPEGPDEGKGSGGRRIPWSIVGEGLAPPADPLGFSSECLRCLVIVWQGRFRLRARHGCRQTKVPKNWLRNLRFLRTSLGGDLLPAFLPIRRSWSNTLFSHVLSHLGGGRLLFLPTGTAGPGWWGGGTGRWGHRPLRPWVPLRGARRPGARWRRGSGRGKPLPYGAPRGAAVAETVPLIRPFGPPVPTPFGLRPFPPDRGNRPPGEGFCCGARHDKGRSAAGALLVGAYALSARMAGWRA